MSNRICYELYLPKMNCVESSLNLLQGAGRRDADGATYKALRAPRALGRACAARRQRAPEQQGRTHGAGALRAARRARQMPVRA
jgi:hypothetical protein